MTPRKLWITKELSDQHPKIRQSTVISGDFVAQSVWPWRDIKNEREKKKNGINFYEKHDFPEFSKKVNKLTKNLMESLEICKFGPYPCEFASFFDIFI